jgi:hypothetical protein
MARSEHPVYTAVERAERRAYKRRRPIYRRQQTRQAIVAAAVKEEV